MNPSASPHCPHHPHHILIGVCAICLKERLELLEAVAHQHQESILEVPAAAMPQNYSGVSPARRSVSDHHLKHLALQRRSFISPPPSSSRHETLFRSPSRHFPDRGAAFDDRFSREIDGKRRISFQSFLAHVESSNPAGQINSGKQEPPLRTPDYSRRKPPRKSPLNDEKFMSGKSEESFISFNVDRNDKISWISGLFPGKGWKTKATISGRKGEGAESSRSSLQEARPSWEGLLIPRRSTSVFEGGLKAAGVNSDRSVSLDEEPRRLSDSHADSRISRNLEYGWSPAPNYLRKSEAESGLGDDRKFSRSTSWGKAWGRALYPKLGSRKQSKKREDEDEDDSAIFGRVRVGKTGNQRSSPFFGPFSFSFFKTKRKSSSSANSNPRVKEAPSPQHGSWSWHPTPRRH